MNRKKLTVVKEVRPDVLAVKISLREKGRVLGWAYVYLIFQDRHAEPYAYLENVYVKPAYREQGLGGRLLKLAVAEARARGCYKIIGTSKAHKTDVHRWYEKHGFVKMGVEFRLDLIPDSKVITKD